MLEKGGAWSTDNGRIGSPYLSSSRQVIVLHFFCVAWKTCIMIHYHVIHRSSKLFRQRRPVGRGWLSIIRYRHLQPVTHYQLSTANYSVCVNSRMYWPSNHVPVPAASHGLLLGPGLLAFCSQPWARARGHRAHAATYFSHLRILVIVPEFHAKCVGLASKLVHSG